MKKNIIIIASVVLFVTVSAAAGLGYYVLRQVQITDSLNANVKILDEVSVLAKKIEDKDTDVNSKLDPQIITEIDTYLLRSKDLLESVSYGPTNETKEIGNLTKNMIESSVPVMEITKDGYAYVICLESQLDTITALEADKIQTDQQALILYTGLTSSYKELENCFVSKKIADVGDLNFSNIYTANNTLQASPTENNLKNYQTEVENISAKMQTIQNNKKKNIETRVTEFEKQNNQSIEKAKSLKF